MRRIRRKLVPGLVAAGAVAAAVVVVPTAFAGQPAAAPGPAPERPVAQTQPAAKPATVTLITGDRVTVSPAGVAYQPAPGRAGVRFTTWTADGHHYVVPSDALPLLRRKRLDQRLFDVTALRDFGYTGDRELPLLLAYPRTGRSKGSAGVRAAVRATARLGRDLPGVGVLAVRAKRAERVRLWSSLTTGTADEKALRPAVQRVYLDGQRRLNLDVSVPQVGAPQAWAAGFDGTGVTVAVLDSGIDATHPDLAGRIMANENFTDAPKDDLTGHGTHVASTIAGSGAKSGGRYKGVAPGAKLAIGKVCVNRCAESAVLAGMQWAAQVAPVVNMSLGGLDYEGIDPLEQAVEDLTAAHGTLFVIAAGNQGHSGASSIDSPASADAALAVGAVDRRDQRSFTSGRGPRLGDSAIKPDITAPGVDIVAARAANGTQGEPAAEGYTSMSGTSMAAPHVAGAAAIITQQHPDFSPRQRKTLLMGAAQPIDGTGPFDQGAGRLDVARAVRQTVSVDEGSGSFGKQMWPHGDDVPVTKKLTYRNGGTEPVTLSLTVQGATGTFSVADRTLTVPAGGTAATTVTSDTRADGPDGVVSAIVVATAPGDVRVVTPLAVEREVESYDVTFRYIDRDGKPTTDYYTTAIGLDVRGTRRITGDADHVTERLPKGRYGMATEIYPSGDTTLLVDPGLLVDSARTITYDARVAGAVRVTPPRKDAKQAIVSAGAAWNVNGSNAGLSVNSTKPGDLFIGQVGADRDGFQGSVNSVFARWKNDEEEFRDSPYTYETADFRKGAFFTGFDKKITPGELATVRVRYGREVDGTVGTKSNYAQLDSQVYSTAGLPMTLPFERVEYLSAGPGVRWSGDLAVDRPPADPDTRTEPISSLTGPPQRFEPRREYRQEWNQAVFAPAEGAGSPAVTRRDDVIQGEIPMFGDSAGNAGRSEGATGKAELFAGDRLIGSTGFDLFNEFTFPVPGERTDYRLEMSATRPAPFTSSTRVNGTWTFTSGRGDTRLPLSTVRFGPRLDQRNAAPAGRFAVPVTVVRGAGSPAAANRTLTAEFSADDGKTWQPATVSGEGDQRVLHVDNPATGFVSLRVKATDTAGATATVTVLRAYAIG